LPDLAGEPDEAHGSHEQAHDEGEAPSAEFVLSRPPAEVVQLDRFRKK
jgi:hypothetical protein